MHESEKWKWSHSVVSNPQRPHGLQPSRLLRPWDFPGKSTGVGCHCLLTTGQTIALTIPAFVGNLMFLLLNTLSRFVVAFLANSKMANSYMKRFSQSLNIRKINSKPQWDVTTHLLDLLWSKKLGGGELKITRIGEDVEKKKPLCTLGRNVNLCSPYGSQYIGFSNNSK